MKSTLLLGLLIATPVSAADRRADAVIDKGVAAMGGRARIHAIGSLVLRGFHYEGSYHQELAGTVPSNAVMVRMRPNLRMVGCRPGITGCAGKWGRIVETYDGRQGWELNWPKQRLVHTVNKAGRAQRCGAEFDPLFVDYKARGFTATWRGEQTLLGRKTRRSRSSSPIARRRPIISIRRPTASSCNAPRCRCMRAARRSIPCRWCAKRWWSMA